MSEKLDSEFSNDNLNFNQILKAKLQRIFPEMSESNIFLTELCSMADEEHLRSNPKIAGDLIKGALALYPKTGNYSSEHRYTAEQLASQVPAVIDILLSPVKSGIERDIRGFIERNRGKNQWLLD